MDGHRLAHEGQDAPEPRPALRPVPDGSPIVIPGNDAILLGSFGHTGALAVGDSYEQVVKVRIPQQIASGTYYITAWADAYDAVLEDSLASNVNQDDPTTLDSSNFKARAIDIIGTPRRAPGPAGDRRHDRRDGRRSGVRRPAADGHAGR